MQGSVVSLKNYTSLCIGGEAELLLVKKEEDLIEAYANATGKHVHILGLGTNSFFEEELPNLLIVKMENKGIHVEEKNDTVLLTLQAGEVWDDVVKLAVKNNWWGIENLSYIPGTVGAAPVQNIGAYGSELKDTFVSLRAYDREQKMIVELSKDACAFGYRDSLFKHNPGRYSIISVTLKLSKIPHPILSYKPLDTLKEKENVSLSEIRELVIATRTSKLPDYNVYPNAGSFFKNPIVSKEKGDSLKEKYPDIPLIESGAGYKIPAAWLIEHVANMKGEREGSIGSWPQQPLVLVNYDNGNASELMNFSQKIIDIIVAATGVTLEREVNYIK